jgi:hypothetical protein
MIQERRGAEPWAHHSCINRKRSKRPPFFISGFHCNNLTPQSPYSCHGNPRSRMGVWQGVAMDSLKFHLGLPCPTLLRPVGGPPLNRQYSRLRGGPPTGQMACGHLLPCWPPTPYACALHPFHVCCSCFRLHASRVRLPHFADSHTFYLLDDVRRATVGATCGCDVRHRAGKSGRGAVRARCGHCGRGAGAVRARARRGLMSTTLTRESE